MGDCQNLERNSGRNLCFQFDHNGHQRNKRYNFRDDGHDADDWHGNDGDGNNGDGDNWHGNDGDRDGDDWHGDDGHGDYWDRNDRNGNDGNGDDHN
tara:strand:+ start:399 stop:686 length:288 start_codon:yes stop_codon:yes gene_type:complete